MPTFLRHQFSTTARSGWLTIPACVPPRRPTRSLLLQSIRFLRKSGQLRGSAVSGGACECVGVRWSSRLLMATRVLPAIA